MDEGGRDKQNQRAGKRRLDEAGKRDLYEYMIEERVEEEETNDCRK
jgi:hypothetical protein